MKTVNEDLADEVTRRRALAASCRTDALLHRLIAPALAVNFWFQAKRNDHIADEVEALLESRVKIGQL